MSCMQRAHAGRASLFIPILLSFAALLTGTAHAQLPHTYEKQDGQVEDLAGSPGFGDMSASKRVWIAQGRVRASMRASDRVRLHGEDRTFDAALTGVHERLIAVEVDETNNQLFTLTDHALYREDISNPSNPTGLTSLVLDTTLAQYFVPPAQGGPSADEPRDLKIYASGHRVFVLTRWRILSIESTTSGLALRGSADELAQSGFDPVLHYRLLTDSAGAIDPLKIHDFQRLRIFEDIDGKVYGYVVALMAGYGTRNTGRTLLVCNLAGSGAYNDPTFDATAGPLRSFVNWNFVPCLPGGCTGVNVPDFALNDVDLRRTSTIPPRTQAYCGLGAGQGIHVLDVTQAFVPGNPISYQRQMLLQDPTPGAGLLPAVRLKLSSTDPTRIAVIHGPNLSNVRDLSGPGSPFTTQPAVTPLYSEPVGNGGNHDFLLTEPTAAQAGTAWTAVIGQVDHIGKVFDMTSGANDQPLLVDEYFMLYGSDGGVALPPDAIYLPSWGGVIRYKLINGQWRPQAYAYQPAEEANNLGNVAVTEHIVLGTDMAFAGDHRLFTADGTGGFGEYPIDPATKNPLPTTFTRLALASVPGWAATDTGYANDVVVADTTVGRFVLTEYSNFTRKEAGVIAWKPSPGGGQPGPQLAATTLNLAGVYAQLGVGQINTTTMHVAEGTAGRRFVFVTHGGGFFIVDVNSLPASIAPVDRLDGDPAFPCAGAAAIATSGNFVYVVWNRGSNVTGSSCSPVAFSQLIAVYLWDPSTGLLLNNHSALQYIDNTQLPGPAKTWGMSFRSRFLLQLPSSAPSTPTDGCGRLHICADQGMLLEFKRESTGKLSYSNYWRSDYQGGLQDCRSYVFDPLIGPQLLVAKDEESFSIVTPTATTSCP